MDFHPKIDNILLSCSGDKRIKIWNIETFTLLKTIKTHRDWIYCARFDLTGDRIFSGSGDKVIAIHSFNYYITDKEISNL